MKKKELNGIKSLNNWNIINNDINNICDKSEKHSKENGIIIEYEDFFQELLCCEASQMFYSF